MRRRSARRARGPGPSGVLRLGRPTAVTFDLWYTLVYTRGRSQARLEARRRRCWEGPLREAGRSDGEAKRLVDRMIAWSHAEEERGRNATISDQAARLAALARTPVDGRSVAAGLDGALRDATVRLTPGAMAAVAAVRRNGIPIGLISNLLSETSEGGRELLARVGLEDKFDAVYLSCEHPWTKPSREPFRWTLRELGVAAHGVWHVGDHPYDLRGAAAAGMVPLLYSGVHSFERLPLRFTAKDRSIARGSLADWRKFPSWIDGRSTGPRGR